MDAKVSTGTWALEFLFFKAAIWSLSELSSLNIAAWPFAELVFWGVIKNKKFLEKKLEIFEINEENFKNFWKI